MSDSSALHLPIEILAIIINELASDIEDNDKTSAALACCRLASHVLCSLATPLFFSSIRLTDWFGSKRPGSILLVERARKLNEILSVHNIAASVRTLTLHCSHYETLKNSISGTLMSAILHRLPHIRSFTLAADEEDYFFSIPEDFASAIQTLCRSPNLTRLYLDNIECFPFMAITTSPNLRCLRLWRIIALRFDDVNSRDGTSSPQILSLDSLEIDRYSMDALGSRIPEDISIATHFSRIKKLQLKSLFSYASVLRYGWNIMLLASQTLTTLELPESQHKGTDRIFNNVPFDLGRFPALRHFKIQQRSSCQDNLTHLHFLTQLLSMSSSSSCIETLEVEITWNRVTEGHGKNLFSPNAGWSTLDQLLSSRTFGSLNKLILHLRLEMEKTKSAEERDLCNDSDQEHISELERNLTGTLPYVNNLFPLFRALTQPTLEINFKLS